MKIALFSICALAIAGVVSKAQEAAPPSPSVEQSDKQFLNKLERTDPQANPAPAQPPVAPTPPSTAPAARSVEREKPERSTPPESSGTAHEQIPAENHHESGKVAVPKRANAPEAREANVSVVKPAKHHLPRKDKEPVERLQSQESDDRQADVQVAQPARRKLAPAVDVGTKATNVPSAGVRTSRDSVAFGGARRWSPGVETDGQPAQAPGVTTTRTTTITNLPERDEDHEEGFFHRLFHHHHRDEQRDDDR